MSFFHLRTPKDMLEKAHREHGRLTTSWNIDNLFNFFVTAYHIRDYILMTGAVERSELDEFFRDPDMSACRDMCNKGKHLTLVRQPEDPKTLMWSGCLGGAPLGSMPLGAGDVWVLHTADRAIDVKCLAERVLAKWDAFFAAKGLHAAL